MSNPPDSSSNHVFFDEHGVMITDTHVRTQTHTYALSGSAFSRMRSSECLEPDPEATRALRRRIMPWGAAGVVLLGCGAALQLGGLVASQFQLAGLDLSAFAAQSIAFGIGAAIGAVALAGGLLCARVQRRYRLYHVYLDTRAGRREILNSRNEGRIAAIAAALDKAIARLSVAANDSAAGGTRSPQHESSGSFAAST